MTKPKILITSAAGHTGSQAALHLLKLGFPVRALVRRIDGRSEALKKAGAEIMVGDQLDFGSLQQAMQGVKRAYHCPPFAPNLLENLMMFAIAAEEAKLEVVALMSAWNGTSAHPSIHSRSHWIANQIFRMMPTVGVIHINPGLFAFTYMLGLPIIANLGMFVAPLGQGRSAPPSNEDIGRVAACALAEPDRHVGKSYRPTGPSLLSPDDIADIYSNILNRNVTYKNAPFSMFSKAALAQGFPLFDISQVRYFTEELRNGAFAIGGVTEHVEQVTGEKPESFEVTARRYLANPSLVHPALTTGNKRSATLFLLRMILTRAPDLEAWERQRDHPSKHKPELSHQSSNWMMAAENHEL